MLRMLWDDSSECDHPGTTFPVHPIPHNGACVSALHCSFRVCNVTGRVEITRRRLLRKKGY